MSHLGISPVPQDSVSDQPPTGGHDHEDPAQERSTTDRAQERGRIVRDPFMEGEHDHEERHVPADDLSDDVTNTRGYGVVPGSSRPRDRPAPRDERHRDEDRKRREQRRKDDPQHGPQLRRKKPQTRMNRCQPSQSHRPNTRKRPRGTAMKDRKKSDRVGHSGPRTRPMPCQTRSAPTIQRTDNRDRSHTFTPVRHLGGLVTSPIIRV
jgi:hypothetical protein